MKYPQPNNEKKMNAINIKLKNNFFVKIVRSLFVIDVCYFVKNISCIMLQRLIKLKNFFYNKLKNK